MKTYLLILIISLFFRCFTENPPVRITVSDMKCNYLENPCGTGNMPDFSWTSTSEFRGKSQSGYRIIVDDDELSAVAGKGRIWDSGKILSHQSSGIRYGGKKTDPGKKYFWRVMVWDESDNKSEWSKTSWFITGLFEKKDWEEAEWIGFEEIADSLLLVPGVHGNGDNLGQVAKKRTVVPYFRKEFDLNRKIKQAFIFVSGLGQYELSVNGEKIGDHFLSPGWSDYRKTCLYNTFDITGFLKKGRNTLGVIAGNGFFNINRERYRKLVVAYGAPEMILKLSVEYEDGTKTVVTSNASWKTSPSPVTYTSIYGGEDYDARLEQKGWDKPGFDDSLWKDAIVVKEPGGILKPENSHPVKVMETLNRVRISKQKESSFIYDFGQNASGIIKIRITGRQGQEIRIIPGELLGDDSLVTQRATGDPYYLSYILKGDREEVWIPKFTYYGFRFAEVRGAVPEGFENTAKLPSIKEMQFLHTRNSSPVNGSFSCSSQLFNSVYNLIDWSVRSNLASVATDCPHREKLGWLEQTHLMGNSIRYIYDIHNLYNKIIDDMIDAQLENGLVPDIAPEFVPFAGGFRDSPEWGSAAVILPWDMYNWYGDIEAIRKAYPMMKKYIVYLDGKAKDNILSHGLGDWFDLGPKSPGEAQLTPKALTATSIYFYDVRLMAEMATLTGNNNDALYYREKAESIRKSFNLKFFNKETKVYSTGSQTAYAMPLFFGMTDENVKKEVVANLISSIIKDNKALTAGDVGYRYLLRTLEQEGYSQLIFDMNSRSDVPGYGYQLSKGATSLTESWAALRYVSNNHMMLGHLMEWFYSGLAGIRQSVNADGTGRIEISPEPVGDINWVKASYRSIYGEIICNWEIRNSEFIVKISIPLNCRALIRIPQNDPRKITADGKILDKSPDVSRIIADDKATSFEAGSGNYTFTAVFLPKAAR
jgi:alpha-L-rhamnosidase